MLERYSHPIDGEMQRAVRVLSGTTGANTGASENRAIRLESPKRGNVLSDLMIELASSMPASWNQVAGWLKQIDGLRPAADYLPLRLGSRTVAVWKCTSHPRRRRN
jgi:hypothetical protein